jgi:hypothetical protein
MTRKPLRRRYLRRKPNPVPWTSCTTLHQAQTIALTRRSYRLKDHAAIAGKEEIHKKIKAKPNEPSTAEPVS